MTFYVVFGIEDGMIKTSQIAHHDLENYDEPPMVTSRRDNLVIGQDKYSTTTYVDGQPQYSCIDPYEFTSQITGIIKDQMTKKPSEQIVF